MKVSISRALRVTSMLLPALNEPYQDLPDLWRNYCRLSNPQNFASGIACIEDIGPGCVLNGHDGSWLTGGQDAILIDKDIVDRLMPVSVGCLSSLLIRVYALKNRWTEARQIAADGVLAGMHLPGESSSLWNALGNQPHANNGTPVVRTRDQSQICLRDVSAQTASLVTSPPPCPIGLCLWRDPGASEVCGAPVSCKDVPKHFSDAHCIKGMKWNRAILCSWDGCGGGAKFVRRKFIVRHLRERHLGHRRAGHHGTGPHA
ncbi:hypothetical protein PAXRUDRAFT_35893 [Paxillus rubicundulus Ve08.2h10]|uniref:Uncharacterized protein n=1 Tax=Paxillus rubicundulus Ve08.2h10 TaxID=930991 RepID=A0A0D0D088_9AGAM|nr:hypothetical protein PAXRUDRAFT_35893 [Paxillus rubicundulus Ve08.2h10]